MPPLMQVLEHIDNTGTVMVARVPQSGDCEIQWGAQLTVRESQNAVFFRDGQSLVVFPPGRYVLATQNIPTLTKFFTSMGYGPTSPFRSEVYFINMKLFRNLKWGTTDTILLRDTEVQMIRLRAHGMFSVQVVDPLLFLNRMVGTQGLFRDADIRDYLRSLLLSHFISVLGGQKTGILDLASCYGELGIKARAACSLVFAKCGLELQEVMVNAITPTEEVQGMIDERTKLGVMGNTLDSYTKLKVAQAVEKAAANTSGAPGTMLGLIAGGGLGVLGLNTAQKALAGGDPATSATAAPPRDPCADIAGLKKLLDAGAITQKEFDESKKALLRKIGGTP
ncbi:MAG: SPFH domain-containing protein [Lysobacterales bacterium]|nr:MAG: SPFH domain-containing protein [Xanthomonadales bacterium]